MSAAHFPRELAEAALAHIEGDATEQAYRRSDALEKRRTLMQAWANYCEPQPAKNVVPFANDQQVAGNDGLPWGNAAQAAYETPCTSADSPADVFRDERWTNGDANASAWTQ